MSDRVLGFDWNDTDLIRSLAAATRDFAFRQREAEGVVVDEPRLRKAISKVCPHVSDEMQAAILAEAARIGNGGVGE